jgi:hypothetical protein
VKHNKYINKKEKIILTKKNKETDVIASNKDELNSTVQTAG